MQLLQLSTETTHINLNLLLFWELKLLSNQKTQQLYQLHSKNVTYLFLEKMKLLQQIQVVSLLLLRLDKHQFYPLLKNLGLDIKYFGKYQIVK